MEELAEGELLAGRYLLGPVAGHGAMGEVHLAEDLRLARPVAIKSLRPELARYPSVRQRFGQEARAAARINHPNVVRVYDSGEQGRIPYLVMECLPGSTLVDELAWGPLDLPRARRVGLDVLGALEAAHRMGIVHRDVKPGNILLTAAVDGPVKVSDFGIAKSADDRSLTDSGSLVGTAAYLAPERVAGSPATPASDLYSLGVVLYEAVAGRKPYEGETSLAIALAIHMGGAPGLLELQPDLDPAFAELVERAIAHEPADRWESAGEMAEALRAWGATEARPVPGGLQRGAGPPVGAPFAPPATLAMAPGAGGGPVVADPAPTRPLVPPDDRPTPVTSPRRRPRRTAVLAGAGAAALLLVVAVAGMARRGDDKPPGPVTATTSAEVAGPAPGPPPPPETTVMSRRPAATTRTTRRAAPATVAKPPPTRATTTTTRVPTTRPTPSTAPPTSPATSPPTVASPASVPAT